MKYLSAKSALNTKKKKKNSPGAEKCNQSHKADFKPNIQNRQHFNGGAAVWLSCGVKLYSSGCASGKCEPT